MEICNYNTLWQLWKSRNSLMYMIIENTNEYIHIHMYINTWIYIHVYMNTCICNLYVWGLSGKSPAIFNIPREQFAWYWYNLAAKESRLECTCMNNDDFTVLVSGGGRRCSVSMCILWWSHSKWLSNEYVSNFVLSLNIPPLKLFGWLKKATPMGNCWLAASSRQCPLIHHISCRGFWQNIKSPRWLSPHYSPDLVPCDFWLFPKLKSPLKRKRFQTINEILENTMGRLVVIGRTVWGPKEPILKRT